MLPPIVTATTQAAGLSAISNLCAQFIGAHRAHRPFSLDPTQLARFVCFTLLNAPLNYLWQQFLERTFPGYPGSSSSSSSSRGGNNYRQDLEKGRHDDNHITIGKGAGREASSSSGGAHGTSSKPKLNLRNTFIKWFLDGIFLGALFNTVMLLVVMGALKGESVKVIQRNLETRTIPIIVASYKIWPVACLVSFSFVPVERRIVFLAFVGLLWGIYVSMLAATI